MSSNSSPALSHSKSSGRGVGCSGFFLYGIFLLVGSITSYLFFFSPLINHFSIQSWIETPCHILKNDVRWVEDRWEVNIEYEYDYLGETFRGHNYRHPQHPDGRKVRDRNRLADFQPNQKAVCFVNPADHEEAVLNRDLSYTIWIGSISLVFVVIGLVGLIGTAFGSAQSRSRQESSPAKFSNRGLPSSPAMQSLFQKFQGGLDLQERTAGSWNVTYTKQVLWQPEYQAGPQELKSQSSGWGAFIVLSLFGLFWNGIISIFVKEVIDDWAAGKQPWFLTLFMIPFLLAGIVVIISAIYSMLSLFNPRAKLFISDAAIRLGQKGKLKWVLEGKVSSIRNFTVRLKATEKATYTRGTDTYTDTNVFWSDLLINTTDLYEIESGEVEFEVPVQLVPSLSAIRNEITWTVEIQGRIAMWPDVQATFPLVVLP